MSNIIIPSKNLYKITNQKVINNRISRVEAEAKNVQLEKDFDTVVYNQTTDTSDLFDGITFNDGDEFTNISSYFGNGEISFKSYSYFTGYYYWYAVCAASRRFAKRISFKIPQTNGDEYIERVFSGKNKNGTDNIQKSATYRFQEAAAYFTATKKSGYDPSVASNERYSFGSLYALGSNSEWETQSGSLPDGSISVSYSPSETSPTVSASFDAFRGDDLAKIKITFDETDKTYNCSALVLCGLMEFSSVIPTTGASGDFPNTISSSDTDIPGIDLNGNEYGYLKIYEPLDIEFSFHGNTIKLDINEEKVTIGDENSTKTFSATSSELLQQPVSQDLFEPIITQYENGKETATVLCSISDYFSDDGSIAIDTKTGKMSFDIGDLVVPMIFSAGGEDRPMSKYMDGTPKVFRVVGIKFIYDGAVWQELTLQEV